MKTIAIINMKGGCAKTTTSVNMGYILAEDYDKKVLIIDNDKQGNLSKACGVWNDEAPSFADVLTGDKTLTDVMQLGANGNIAVVPANMTLLTANLEVIKNEEIDQVTILSKELEKVKDVFDYCIIDCPPDINISVINALVAADEVIIPIKIDGYAFDGMKELEEQINNAKQLNPKLKFRGCLVTMFYNRDVCRQGEEYLQNQRYPVFRTHIRRTEKADEVTGKAIIDADTETVKVYSDVPTWKSKNNITQPSQLVTWPKYTLGGKIYHSSVHQAGVMSKTDATEDLGGGSPCESASNKTIQIDGMALADGTEVLLDLVKANYLNSNGIITALNLTGSFVSWGNETACYPANTDVTDYFYCVSRMFSWVANSVILSMWSKVDKKLNKRLIESVTQSINIWLNGLMAEEKILGGRVEFLEEENTTADLLAGKAKFHIYLTPPSPAKELDFVLEYDVSYLENIFA